MELPREIYHGALLDSDAGFTPATTTVEVRVDPLTGHTSRLVAGASARIPSSDFDVAELARATRTGCPFCAERIDVATPKFLPEISVEGRLRVGEAVVFPNLVAYARHATVAVYGPARHHLLLPELSERLIADNLAAQTAALGAIVRADPAADWEAVSANHMLPAGSSLFHPHTQATAHPGPTTMQARLAAVAPDRFTDYLDTERRAGTRFLATTGQVHWLAAFAPIGPAELCAFIPSVTTPSALTAHAIDELAAGLAAAYDIYAELGFTSFNLALYGAPSRYDGYPLNLRLIARSAVAPLYRSDATNMERLHWESVTEITPEDLATRARAHFAPLDQRWP